MITGFDISKFSSFFFVVSIFLYLNGGSGTGCMLDVVMGYLLKEALKTICGVNKWSYAVFWKIGCQNPKLLIWEECYYEPITQSDLPHISGIENRELAIEDWEDRWVSAEARTSSLGVQARGRVHSIVNKMRENQVNVVGQGLVGRAAFTGNHQWIISENYTVESHPPEVLKEACQQFSAGMQTLAVIPVLPHGVVQLGSSMAIMEDMGFVNEVKTLVRQLGCVPGALLSDSNATNEPSPKMGVPISFGNSVSADLSGISKVTALPTFIADSRSQLSGSSLPPRLVGQSSYSLNSTSSTFQNSYIAQDSVKSNDDNCTTNSIPIINSSLQFRSQLENGVARAHVIPSNPDVWLNQETSLYTSRAGYGQQPYNGSSAANNGNQKLIEQQTLLDANYSPHVPNSFNMSQQRINGGLSSLSHKDFITAPSLKLSELHSGCENVDSSRAKVSTSNFSDHLTTSPLPSGKSHDRNLFVNEKETQFDLAEGKEGVGNDIFQALGIPLSAPDEHTRSSQHIPSFLHDSDKHTHGNSGDDLFDVLGVDFKNKLFNGSWNSFFNEGPHTNKQRSGKNDCGSIKLQDVAGSDVYSVNEGNADSGIFSVNGSDHLLDAVVSRVHSAAKQSSEDNVSCKTTLTNSCSSSVPLACLSSGRENLSNQIQGEKFSLPKSLTKAGALGSCSFRSGSSKEDAGTYSQTSSIYGSQISSWVEQEHGMKRNGSVSSAHSKRPDEISKSNRKRFKPGENPRPRPKDRQMIQDRVKELREIVPNSAKCSIDALLERTIKHMLFLQSVTKHADKLNQTGGEPKIISQEGGLLLKANFHGGATWAYEVGSQSMVCPIKVEDLNQPRQMLVEMLCEERGLFLEIADIVRGLGLTILKGVMETRNDKIWACFAVEANRDVKRMEIFISLVHLLEQTIKSSAVPGNCIDKDNIAVHQSFHQAVSIPASGRPCGFQ